MYTYHDHEGVLFHYFQYVSHFLVKVTLPYVPDLVSPATIVLVATVAPGTARLAAGTVVVGMVVS